MVKYDKAVSQGLFSVQELVWIFSLKKARGGVKCGLCMTPQDNYHTVSKQQAIIHAFIATAD